MESFPSPVPSSTLVPDWWKNGNTYTNKNATPKNGSVYATVKKCQAIFDSMTAGYYLLCPVDIYIDATKEKLDIQVPKEYIGRYHHIISSHSQEQLQGYPRPNGYHKDLIRIHPHWLTKSEKGYSALDILSLLENPKFLENSINSEKRYELLICFNRVRKEFRNEKLLILFILNFIFLSSEMSLENISFM